MGPGLPPSVSINYYRGSSSEPCCAFPIAADPFVGMIEGVDCGHQSLAMDAVTSHFNADASCACTQPANLAPYVPTRPDPAENRTAVPLWGRLAWESGDPEAEPVMYAVHFGDQNPPPPVASDVWGSAYDAGLLEYATQYYWFVVARDPLGRETAGPVWTFRTVENPPPAMPSHPSPRMEATNQPLTAKLSWVCSDFDGEKVTYDVYLGDSDSPPRVAEDLPVASFNPGPLAAATTYRWRIVARDVHGGETNGPTWMFSSVAGSGFAVTAGNEGVNVTWRLAAVQGMETYTLYRTEQEASTALAIAQGAVMGATGSYFDGSVRPGSSYRYELVVLSESGENFRSQAASISAKFPQLELGANRPNPFNPRTTIPYFLLVGGHTRLVVYDAAGRFVRTLVNGQQTHGPHEVDWNGTDDRGTVVASGVYIVVLEDSAGERRMRKLVMLK